MASQMCGKVCLVTGASSGIGETVAMMFASRGASVTLCGRDTDRLKKALDQCIKISGGLADRFIMVCRDITKQEVRKEMVEATVNKFERLDVAVASAGIMPHQANILSATEDMYDRVMNTNLKSVAFLIQLAVPHLEKTEGSIVTISSFASTVSTTPDNIYAMAKAALDHLTRCLVLDLGPKGVRINSVNPAYLPTGITRERGGDAAKIAHFFSRAEAPKHPLHGRCATVEEVAETITFLSSDAARFITGECIKVDGGRALFGALKAK